MEQNSDCDSGRNPLFSLYEKLYFHEIEVRENLTGRLQLPLAIIVSLVGGLIYLLQHVDLRHKGWLAPTFWGALTLGAVSITSAGYFFVRSWFGATYAFFPAAEEAERYRLLLDKTYASYHNGADLSKKYLHEFLCLKFIECATRNTRSNDSRSLFLHRTNGALIASTVFLASAFLLFFCGRLDSSQGEKFTQVVVAKPIEVRGFLMSDSNSGQKPTNGPPLTTPPPPPPPPPTRIIREGVEIKAPPKEPSHGK